MSRKQPRHNTLFRKLLVVNTTVAFLPLVFLSVYMSNQLSSRLELEAENYLVQLNRTVSSQVGQLVEEVENFVLYVASTSPVTSILKMDRVDPQDLLELDLWFEQNSIIDFFTHRQFFHSLILFNNEQLLFSSGDAIPYFSEATRANFIEHEGPLLQLRLARGTNQSGQLVDILGISRKVFTFNPDDPRGIFFAQIDVVRFAHLWSDFDLKGGEVYVLDHSGRIVFHTSGESTGDYFNDAVTPLPTNGSSVEEVVRNTDDRVFISSNVPDHGWRVVISVPTQRFKGPVRQVRSSIILIATVLLGLVLLLSYAMIRSYTQPLAKLNEVMIGSRESRLRKVDGPFPTDEIGQVMNHFNLMVDDVNQLIGRIYQEEVELHRLRAQRNAAKIEALQLQINPHFLYNTLGALKAFSYRNRGQDMRTLIDALSDMLRYAVRSPLEIVRVHDELEHLENFLLIQRLRLDTMPHVHVETNSLEEHPMLRLSLQPLVENIFKYAFPDGIDETHQISLQFQLSKDFFTIVIEDNGKGVPIDVIEQVSSGRSKGIGIQNVNQRIKMKYGEEYGLFLQHREDGGTRVDLVMPNS